MPATQPDLLHTRQRLLDTAGEVFAEQGFRAATIREICRRAGANVAAVNYHFGDKEKLYGQVLRDAHRTAMSKYPPDLGVAPDADVRRRLHAFVRSFLFRIFDEGRPAWHGKLIAREIADPTPALETMVDEMVRPNFLAIRGIVTELLGGKPSPQRVRYSAWSVVAQCLFYFYARPVISRLNPAQSFAQDEIETIARHVTDFSLAALAPVSSLPAPQKRGGRP